MSDLFLLLFNTALVNNLVLTYLIGVDSQFASSRRISAAWLTGLATLYCLAISVPFAWLVRNLIIIPLQIQYMDLLLYVMIIITVVLTSKQFFHRLFPILYKQVDAVAPIILMNSVLLAVILLNESQTDSFLRAFFFGCTTGLGFLFLLLVLTCLRERIDHDNIPQPFRSLPILLFTLGILTMGLMGLAGIQ